MEFLTPGEKIKKLRIELGLKQHDLQEANITRNFISMVEGGKRNLSRETVKSVVEIFNREAAKKGIDLDVNEDTLLTPPETEARNYCLSIIENQKMSEIDVVIDICKSYKLTDVLANACTLKADSLYDENDFILAFKYYYDSLECYKSLGNEFSQAFMYNKLGKCKYRTLSYDDSLLFFDKAYTYSILYEDEATMKNSLYNLALVHKQIENFDVSLKYIEIYLSLNNLSIAEYIGVLITKSNCYMNKHEYQSAIECYDPILNNTLTPTPKQLAMIYNNLGLLYSKIENLNKSLEYFNKSEAIREIEDPFALSHTLIDKSKLYMRLNDFDKSIDLINRGIELTNKYNDSSYKLEAYVTLEKIYNTLNDSYNIERIYKEIINILKDSVTKEDLYKMYLKLSLLLIEEGKVDEGKKYLLESLISN